MDMRSSLSLDQMGFTGGRPTALSKGALSSQSKKPHCSPFFLRVSLVFILQENFSTAAQLTMLLYNMPINTNCFNYYQHQLYFYSVPSISAEHIIVLQTLIPDFIKICGSFCKTKYMQQNTYALSNLQLHRLQIINQRACRKVNI